jgi:hypothetical protein
MTILKGTVIVLIGIATFPLLGATRGATAPTGRTASLRPSRTAPVYPYRGAGVGYLRVLPDSSFPDSLGRRDSFGRDSIRGPSRRDTTRDSTVVRDTLRHPKPDPKPLRPKPKRPWKPR